MEGSGKNKIMMIVIILLLVLLLATIAGISWYVITELNKEPSEQPPVTPPPVVVTTLADQVTYSVGSTITRNLLNLGSGRGWYLQVDVSFEIDGLRDPDGVLYNLLDEKIDLVRDILNEVIGKYSYEDLQRTANGEDSLKQDILQAVSDAFETNILLKVNFANIRYVPLSL
jgi:flagellar basal body-associated protein FliL